MGHIKKNWFLILNGLILLATLVVFVLGVMGSSSAEATAIKNIESGCKNLEALAKKKPTKEWYALLDSKVAALESDKKAILSPLLISDNLIHRFFDLNNREIIVSTPIVGRYPEFKEMMQEKWLALSKRFCLENAPFSCKPEILTALEPTWLRTAVTPGKASEVSDAMKRYWITLEVFDIFDKVGLISLEKMAMGPLSEDPNYAYGGKPFWGVRTLEITLHLESHKIHKLLKMFHDSALLFRVVGINVKNEFSAPSGVTSNADYVVFDGIERQALSLVVQHYDYVQEGEELVLEAGIAQGINANNARSGRR